MWNFLRTKINIIIAVKMRFSSHNKPKRCRLGLRPDPLESSQCSSDTVAGFKGMDGLAEGKKGLGKGQGKEGERGTGTGKGEGIAPWLFGR